MLPTLAHNKPSFAAPLHRFVSLQDIPKNADRAPSRTNYTWRATIAGATARVACMLYRSAGNLLARMAAESKANKELFRRVELVNAGRMDKSQLDERAVAKLKMSMHVLQLSLLKLDAEVALFAEVM